MANILYQSLQPGLEDAYLSGSAGLAGLGPAMLHNGQDDANLVYSTSELNDPEYSTDDFRMFSFKVARCSKRYVHDWRSCPFAHPTENARRRDPRTVRYLPVPCPDYKRGICMRGDTCPYSHGVYECWLHPAKYRTQLCKEGPSCRRPVCFFAHSVGDLRQPSHLWDGNADSTGSPSTAAALLMQQSLSGDILNESDVMQSAAEEAFNNMQQEQNNAQSLSNSAEFPLQTSAGQVDSASPPRSPSAAGSQGDRSPMTPTHDKDPFMSCPNEDTNTTTSGNGASSQAGSGTQQDLAMDKGAVVAAAVSAAAASAAAGRVSMDSNMQMQAANQAAQNTGQSWSQSLAASATAAAALAGVPVNEQPMLPNHGPRMSNAVARKLGLVPTKPPTAQPVTATTPRAAAAATAAAIISPRASVDLPSQTLPGYPRNSIDAAISGFVAMPGYAAAPPQYPAMGTYSASYPGADALGIHPALLNLVAANMANGGASTAAGMQIPQQPQQQLYAPAGYAPAMAGGTIDHQHPSVASLLGHMSQWGLSDSSGDSVHTADSSIHSGKNGGNGSVSYPHRGSSDGMLGASGLPQAPGGQAYLLNFDMDNNNRVPSEC